MHELQIKIRQIYGIHLVELTGAIDALAYPNLANSLTRLLRQGAASVILDCTAVSYIGTAPLKGLIEFASRARAQEGDIKCIGVAPTIQQMANLIAMGDLLEFHDDLSSALQAFRRVGRNEVTVPESHGG